jgi:hypothetical protein
LQQPCDTRHAQLNSQHKAPKSNLHKYKTLGENKKLLSGNKKTNEQMTMQDFLETKNEKKNEKKNPKKIHTIYSLHSFIRLEH